MLKKKELGGGPADGGQPDGRGQGAALWICVRDGSR